MLLHDLEKKNKIHPPKWLSTNTVYLARMGSEAYGANIEGQSDVDVCGVCIPPKEVVFPHLAGEILDFGIQKLRFGVWQEHHIKADSGVEYDFSVHSIVRYFDLCMENNPNMIDSLFVPRNCMLHSTAVGEMIRENRRMFLHKGAWHKFKGYAYAQASKIRNKVNSSNEKRAARISEFGYDLKFAYHCVRLMNEVEQIMVEGDLDLQRNREQLKSIRRGEWTLEQFEEYFKNKEHILETTYANSTLPNGPDEDRVKTLLLSCLEQHYGSLSAAVSRVPSMDAMLLDIQALVDKYQAR